MQGLSFDEDKLFWENLHEDRSLQTSVDVGWIPSLSASRWSLLDERTIQIYEGKWENEVKKELVSPCYHLGFSDFARCLDIIEACTEIPCQNFPTNFLVSNNSNVVH